VEGERGIVIEVSTGLCRVELDGDELVCSLRGTLGASGNGFTNAVAVGDRVVVSRNGAQQGTVEAVLPRRGLFTRPDTYNAGHRVVDRGRQQLIAANVDQLLIVASWRQPHLWPELIDRYLIAAQRNGVTPIICVNKMDLAADMTECRTALAPYVDLGYRVIFTSALTGKGVGRLRKALCGRTTVLAGLSGVGKSSLLAAVQPGFTLRTSEVSERSGEGRHTTTQVNLLRLDGGGFVIDTPGIREFGLAGLLPEELLQFYPDLVAAQQDCHFANCSHTHEPDCGVKAAVEAGRLSPVRYHSYVKIHQELSG
jgi:ribosome biogenesis GTPase